MKELYELKKKDFKYSFLEYLKNEIFKCKEDESFQSSLNNYTCKGFYLKELDNNDIGITIGINIELQELGPKSNKLLNRVQAFILNGILKVSDSDITLKIEKYDRVKSLENYNFKSSLVPHISLDQMDSIAYKILRHYYPEALAGEPINPFEFASRLGLRVKAYSYMNRNIMGSIFLDDSEFHTEGPDGHIYTTIIRKNTLMLNSSLIDDNAALLFTMMHECVHYLVHRRIFLIECIINDSPKILQCMTDDKGIMRSAKKDFLAIEWQANTLASRLMLPADALRNMVFKKIITFLKFHNNHINLIDYYEKLMMELSTLYSVYPHAIKLRLIELGFQFPLGCFITVDGKAIDPHVCKKGSLAKYQTFCIGILDAIKFINSLDDKRLLDSFIYVDSHFILNSSKYIEYINNIPHTNLYARTHMDECAIKFKIDFIGSTMKRDRDYRSYRLLNRTKDNKSKIEVLPIQDLNEAFSNINKEEMHMIASATVELSKKINNYNVGACLHTIKDYFKLTIDDLVAKSGLSLNTIKRYLHGDTRYDRKNLIRLLLSINTPGYIIIQVLRAAGIILSVNYDEDNYLAFVIANRWGYPLEDNIDFLKEYNIEL